MKSKVTLFSLLFILLVSAISVFAYLLIGDSSPNANNQLPELALRKAGNKSKILVIDNAQETEGGSWWSGYPKSYIEQGFDSISYEAKEVIISMNGRKKPIPYERVFGSSYAPNKSSNEYKLLIENDRIRTKTYWLGSDRYGRSISSRLILGIRVSLMAGLLAVLVSLMIGVLVGALGGYYGGWVDSIIMYFVNVTWAIPTLLLVFAIVLALGRGMEIIFLAIGLTMWVDVARLVRGQVKEAKEMLYVQAAKSIGQTDITIIFKHILPNIMGPILVITAANFATAILIEAGLSYLGFGINPPVPSLGSMLNENYGYALSGNLSIALAPAITVSLLVLAFNLLGSGLRDVFDVKGG
jgi:ABC-type dipeptide/oligopeptide/nickel transport system permease subunit